MVWCEWWGVLLVCLLRSSPQCLLPHAHPPSLIKTEAVKNAPASGAATTSPIFSHSRFPAPHPYAHTLPSASRTILVSPSRDPGLVRARASSTFGGLGVWV